jgi:hypothetical protein
MRPPNKLDRQIPNAAKSGLESPPGAHKGAPGLAQASESATPDARTEASPLPHSPAIAGPTLGTSASDVFDKSFAVG